MKAIIAALLLLPSLAQASSCQVVVCEKQTSISRRALPSSLQDVKKDVCFVATVEKNQAVGGKAYKPVFRSVQTSYKAKRLHIKHVIGCIDIKERNND